MKLDCLLIHTPKLNDFYPIVGETIFGMYIAQGLFAIADFVSRKGYKVKIIHLGIEKICDANFSIGHYLLENRPKIVGISLHWHFQSFDAIKLAQEIKIFDPDIFIVLGGFTAAFFYEEIMREYKFIDAVIRGDGEIPLLRLIDKFNRGNNFCDVGNLTWRNGKEIVSNEVTYIARQQDLDKLVFTNLELLEKYQLYIKYSRGVFFWSKNLSIKNNLTLLGNGQKIFPLPISRGCSVSCSYCGGGKISQQIVNNRFQMDLRSIAAVLESIKAVKKYGYDALLVQHFPIKEEKSYFERLFDTIRAEDIDINCLLECWALPTKNEINKFKETFKDNFKSSISFSPESGSEKIRKLNKGYYFSNKELIETVKYCIDLKISVEIFFSFGLPFETLDDIKLTKFFQEELKKEFKGKITLRTDTIEIDPGSRMYINPEQYRIKKDRYSFRDFLRANSRQDGLEFFRLGYYGRDLFINKLANAKIVDKQVQRIKCQYFCGLANFISCRFIKGNGNITREIVGFFSNFCCNLISIYWRLRNILKHFYNLCFLKVTYKKRLKVH